AGITFTSGGDVTFGTSKDNNLTISSAPVVIDTSGANANITVNSGISGGQKLTLKTGTGAAAVNGAVQLPSLETIGTGNLQLGGDLTAASGDLIFQNPVIIAGSVKIIGAADHKVAFISTINGKTADQDTL